MLDKQFFVDPFKGVLCLFLLDMGIDAATRFAEFRTVGVRLLLFGIASSAVMGALGIVAGIQSDKIDQLAALKGDRLHLHLTDDQGWRIEIKKWPKLAEYGGSTAVDGDKVQIAAGVTADSIGKVKAGELVNFVASQVGGKGGGKPDMAMAGGTDAAALPKALASVQAWVAERV